MSSSAHSDAALLRQPAGSGVMPLPVSASVKPVCRVRDLRKAFPASGPVLQGASFDIPDGGSTALIGSNGAGKSTLMRSLVLLIRPDSGSVELFGRDITKMSSGQLRRQRARVGFIFQKHNLVPRLSVLSNVIHGAQARLAAPTGWFQALAPKSAREEALHCLARVGLADLAGRRADRLSGGQSQRVAIARALMQRPELVLADEPVASLDPKAGTEIMDLLMELMREDRTTVLFSSHSLDHATSYADQVIGMQAGRVTLNSAAVTIDHAELRRIYEN